jgi:hypothetical protein
MKENLEDFYADPDPWRFQETPDDAERKAKILAALTPYGMFDMALDLGAGEGWLTRDLPAYVRDGYELSDTAAARFPHFVNRVLHPSNKYDLVVATGVLYPQYDWQELIGLINTCSERIILTCNIMEWEVGTHLIHGKQVFDMEFPYRNYTQKMRIFDRCL